MPEKIAFITGGNRGLGFQTALELKDEAKVVIGSRDPAQGAEAVKKLRAAGADADVLQFDVTQPASHQAAYDYFNSRYGTAGHSGEQCRNRGRNVSGDRAGALCRRCADGAAAQSI